MEIDATKWSEKHRARWRAMVRGNSASIEWMADRRKRHQRKRAEQRAAYKKWRRFLVDEYRLGVLRGYVVPRGSFKALNKVV